MLIRAYFVFIHQKYNAHIVITMVQKLTLKLLEHPFVEYLVQEWDVVLIKRLSTPTVGLLSQSMILGLKSMASNAL